MGKNKKWQILMPIISFLILFLQSCANMLAPTGGQKDTSAPKLVRSYPQNYSTNFNADKIELEFNEYIVLKDIQNQLIVSPGNIETDVRKSGKKLIVNFKNKLENNTTYILNFGNSISDYTESNINKEFKFIFSTSEKIDSLNISGRLIDAYKTEAIKEALICLYTDVNDDSIIYKTKPIYTTKTDDNGNFIFTNLKENKYKLIALLENNNNKIYDSQDEQIAFIDTTLNIKNNTDLNILKLFKEIPTKTKVLDKKIEYQKIELILNKKYSNYQLIENNTELDTIIYNAELDTINVYYKNKIDSSVIYFKFEDKIDTIKNKFPKNIKTKKLILDVNSKNDTDKILIYSNNKIKNILTDSIILFEDSNSVKYKLNKGINYLEIVYDFNTNKKYKLNVKDSSIVDFQNLKNTAIKKDIEFFKEEDFGVLELKFKGELKNKIIEIYNDKNIVISKIDLNKINHKTLKKLNAGTYKIRIIDDINNNKKWDTGNYIKKIQPEPVRYYKEEIKIRANWELELEVNL